MAGKFKASEGLREAPGEKYKKSLVSRDGLPISTAAVVPQLRRSSLFQPASFGFFVPAANEC